MPEGLSAPELLRAVYGACGLDSWLRRVWMRSWLRAFESVDIKLRVDYDQSRL